MIRSGRHGFESGGGGGDLIAQGVLSQSINDASPVSFLSDDLIYVLIGFVVSLLLATIVPFVFNICS